MSKRIIYKISAFLFFSFLTFLSYAQPPEPGDDPGGSPGGGVPLDAGLTALLVVGAGYGAKKAFDYRKKNKKE